MPKVLGMEVDGDLHKLIMKGTPDDWSQAINAVNEEKGWNEQPISEGDYAALFHSEISEGFEAYRDGRELFYIENGKPEGAAVEYADAVIRILHWFARKGISMNQVLAAKVAYNKTRPYRHGGKKV